MVFHFEVLCHLLLKDMVITIIHGRSTPGLAILSFSLRAARQIIYFLMKYNISHPHPHISLTKFLNLHTSMFISQLVCNCLQLNDILSGFLESSFISFHAPLIRIHYD